MAHQVENMAYIHHTPWHGLGQHLPEHQPLEVWLKAAGMDWQINEAEVLYRTDPKKTLEVQEHAEAKVLFRSDTHLPLSVVSNRYQVVQPREILEFYRDLVSVEGFELETAGVLKGGKKLWALAKTGLEADVRTGDAMKAYLLLATSCDGTLCTTAQFTSVRVVCNNTLQLALGKGANVIKVPHSTTFDPQMVKVALGLGRSSWDQFMDATRQLANRKLHQFEAMSYLVSVLGDRERSLVEQPNAKAIQRIYQLYDGQGQGSRLPSASGTAWGLLNAVTEYVDHERRARTVDHRLNSAWFGPGAQIKEKAFTEALQLVA